MNKRQRATFMVIFYVVAWWNLSFVVGWVDALSLTSAGVALALFHLNLQERRDPDGE